MNFLNIDSDGNEYSETVFVHLDCGADILKYKNKKSWYCLGCQRTVRTKKCVTVDEFKEFWNNA